MADNLETSTENNDGLNENLEESNEMQIDYKEQNAKLMEENTQLKERIVQLMEQLKETKKRPMESTSSSPPIKQLKMSEEAEPIDLDAKMDDKEANESVKGKSIPNWLIEVLEWIKQTEMADSSLSISSWTFKQLYWPKLHGKVKQYFVKRTLIFRSERDEFGNLRAKLIHGKKPPSLQIPIASVPLPNYITGFNRIEINFFDGQVLKFIENILPIITMNDGFGFSFDTYFLQFPLHYIKSEWMCQIQNLFKMLAFNAYGFQLPSILDFMRFHPNADDILENIRFIRTNLNIRNIDLLFNWVTKPRADGKKKMLRLDFQFDRFGTELINRIKEEFCVAAHSTRFTIHFLYGPTNEPEFILENEQTNEMLSLTNDLNECKKLVRLPKGEANQCSRQFLSYSKISVQIKEIGEF